MSNAEDYTIKIDKAHNDPSLTFNHTCFRVKDPQKSVSFYENNFGMKLMGKKDFPDMKFSLYFLSFPKSQWNKNSQGEDDVFSAEGILELTHNWGTESQADLKMNNGNEEPHRGFGHICFSYADVEKACAELEEKGVTFKKKMSDGRQKDIAFVLDPDGYWIEIIQYIKGGESVPRTDVGTKFNHTMIRVKDINKTLAFYQNVLGMKILRKSDHPNAKFTLYFLGYPVKEGENSSSKEGVLEVTHNWGTENDPDFHYHNGNTEPQGYGHICVSCKDAAALCDEIETKYGDKLSWAPKFNQGKLKNIAFLKDPDGYSIEIVPHGLTV
ncbi:lactoylglutathione lyase GLO1 NDAI_0K01720 [Naumovozyma dairenensis CBS 421]|uniref:Lactoylglutathione lyase n=1 Tax=Naumovozyma dairenensis (strain ATCC 10597 / BCRC 20456 / CBS 421 / NBRC 0211 / NRRL Y-12639) TaxID=1071378 RepID=G0WHV2_NAUDC|nr:hypothetical protein NDAI_0K01720 [Naumovozyma dairenensis CBS 421]CCD27363.1 hypothetical protein NDAI_0K01720 [Naumovozyma dairenensis CBS 421]